MNYLLQDFQKDIKGIIWWFSGAFLGLSLFSYHPKDPSFSFSGGVATKIQNYCGYFGSFASDALYQFLGLMSWSLVLACFHLGWKSFRKKELFFKTFNFFWLILLMISVTALLSLYFPERRWKENQVSSGGFLGFLLSEGLIGVFNFIGAAITLWTLSVLFWMLYTEKSLKEFFKWPWFFTAYFLTKIHVLFQMMISLVISVFRLLKALLRQMKNQCHYFLKKFQNIFLEKRKYAPFFSSLLKTFKTFFVPPSPPSPPAPSLLSHHSINTEKTRVTKKRSFFPIPEARVAKEASREQECTEKNAEEQNKEEQETEAEESEEEINSQVKTQQTEEREGSRRKPSTPFIWKMPSISLFKASFLPKPTKVNKEEVKEKAHLLKEKLQKFHIKGEIIGFRTGPAVTLFEFKPEADVKISRITELADDLSLALSSESVRIIAPIPGRNVVGIETSNLVRESVPFKDLLVQQAEKTKNMKLPIALGLRADGVARFVDLRKMPHMMVAGSTGSGKSAFIVSALTGLLFHHSPETLRLILIDPKQVDLMSFQSLPHLLMPPLRTPQKALEALKWVLNEMEERYHSMSIVGARNLESFNKILSSSSFSISSYEKAKKASSKKRELSHSLSHLVPSSPHDSPQPYIIIVIEEFGDLMAVDKVPMEKAVVKLAQMARACGIHLILAMQSPRRDVITGLIKTNIPGRMSFKVASKLDSRIILDESGAERLLNCGDMLFLAPGFSQPERCHAPWVEETDITKLIDFWKNQVAFSSSLENPSGIKTYSTSSFPKEEENRPFL